MGFFLPKPGYCNQFYSVLSQMDCFGTIPLCIFSQWVYMLVELLNMIFGFLGTEYNSPSIFMFSDRDPNSLILPHRCTNFLNLNLNCFTILV